jgi:hypothetical protein
MEKLKTMHIKSSALQQLVDSHSDGISTIALSNWVREHTSNKYVVTPSLFVSHALQFVYEGGIDADITYEHISVLETKYLETPDAIKD